LYDEGVLRLSLNTTRQKLKNIQNQPQVTLFLVDPAGPYRTLEVRARAEISPDPDYTFAKKVGDKYGGVDLRDNDKAGGSRVVVSLHPVKINTYG